MISCQHVKVGTLIRLPVTNRRKVGTTSNHHAPYVPGYTRNTMAFNKGKQSREAERNLKKQSQFGLKAEIRLHEAGIASNGRSAYCREYVPGPCTHRPSHHESWGYPKPVSQQLNGAAVEGRINDWGEVVTR